MTKAAVFGIGRQFFKYENEIRNNYEIVCLADNDKNKLGNFWNEFRIISLEEMLSYNYDIVLVLPNNNRMDIIYNLRNKGIPNEIIIPYMPSGGNLFAEKAIKVLKSDCLLSFDDVKFKCKTTSDFLCAEDIFVHNTYNFSVPKKDERCIVLDIGMNIGLSTLFLQI